MVKSIVFHIGDPKTGTSSIQDVLFNRHWHCPTVSLVYPDQLNSYPLANSLRPAAQVGHQEARFLKLAAWLNGSGADVAVVSSEQFSRVAPADLLRAIGRYLPDHAKTVRVIAYVRPHTSRLLSTYMQRTKVGLLHSDIASYFENARQEKLLLCADRFRKWRQVFGERFTLRPMIRTELHDGDVVADFLHIVLHGAPFTLLTRNRTNPSLTLEALAGIREIQAELRKGGIAGRTCTAVGNQLGRNLTALTQGAGTKLGLTPALYEQVRALCRKDAAELDREFFFRPIMRQALQAAGRETIETVQNTAPGLHFTPDTLHRLQQYGKALARLFQLNPNAWTDKFEREIGKHARQDPDAELPGNLQVRVQEVGRLLTGSARTIAERRPVGLPEPDLNAPVTPAKLATAGARSAKAGNRGEPGRPKSAGKVAKRQQAAGSDKAGPASAPRQLRRKAAAPETALRPDGRGRP